MQSTERFLLLLSTLFLAATVALSQATETVLYAFQGSPDGSRPVAGLVQDSNGNL